jgi:hypothetical protein
MSTAGDHQQRQIVGESEDYRGGDLAHRDSERGRRFDSGPGRSVLDLNICCEASPLERIANSLHGGAVKNRGHWTILAKV